MTKKQLFKAAQKKRKRFSSLYWYFKKTYGQGFWVQLTALFFGVLFLLIGFILLFIPGPGALFIIIGLAMLSLLSKRMAKILDKTEHRIWRYFAERKRHQKQ